jgi:hypothetical protein
LLVGSTGLISAGLYQLRTCESPPKRGLLATETRDVTFDESKKYDPDDLRPALLECVEEPLQTIEFPDLELARGVESEDEESGKKAIPWQFFILYLEHYLPDCP